MSSCQHCTRKTELHLCTPCTHILGDLLAELPWLLHELDVTITRQDRLVLGSGSAHVLTNPSPINVGAMEIARAAAVTLQQIALDVAQTYDSARIPALKNATPSRAAIWLRSNLGAMQLRPRAGEHYTAIAALVGETRVGQIHRAINRADTRFAGPCPTVRTHDRRGKAVTCNTLLYAHDGDAHVTCPSCAGSVDVEQNRRKAVADNDLLPEHLLLEALRNYGANVDRATLYGWMTGRLRARAYVTSKGIAKRRIRASDPEAFSFAAALRLAARMPAELRILPNPAGGTYPRNGCCTLMPNAAPRVCARCHQPATHGQPCSCRPAYDGSTHPSGNDRRWQKRRAQQLRTHPICQWNGNCRRIATDVDHRVPLAEGGDRYAFSNLQSLCSPHHTIKTTADALRGKTRTR